MVWSDNSSGIMRRIPNTSFSHPDGGQGFSRHILSAVTQHTTIVFHSSLQPVEHRLSVLQTRPNSNNTSTFACLGVQECDKQPQV